MSDTDSKDNDDANDSAESDDDAPGFATQAIHAGTRPDPTTGARITPIYQTASYVFDDVEHAAELFGLQRFGNIYTRITNPTQAALEEKLAHLEGGTAALATASGHAAQLLAFHTLLQPNDEFVAAKQLYGGSINQFTHAFKAFGWKPKWFNPDDTESLKAAINHKTKLVFCESIANPGGRVTDLEAVANIANQAEIPLIVDNTLATPRLCKPLDWGANLVTHSLTKFLGGHGNSIAGAIVDGGNFKWINNPKYPTLSKPCKSYNHITLAETFGNIAFAVACRVLGLRDLGPAIAPLNAFLILTAIETLELRILKHCENTLHIAKWLNQHPKIKWVSYAGLKHDPHYKNHQKYCPDGAGAVFTIGLNGGYTAATKLVTELNLFSHLANVGDTRSLIVHSASTTHKQLSQKQRRDAGAADEVVRISIGLEHPKDLIKDLKQALEKV